MEFIRQNNIELALEKSYRNYLTGHLSRPQPLNYIDNDIEIGISHYKDFTADTPHVHPVATEHGYVLQGKVKIRCFVNGEIEEEEFSEGDFFLIRPGTCHASKNAPNTRVLFIKSPSVNDKTVIDVDDETKKWLSTW